MLNQSFDEKTLLRLTTKKEIITFKLGREQSEYLDSLAEIAKKINAEDFTFKTLASFRYKEKLIYKISSPEEFYVIRKITDNIKRIYKINFSNKDEIVNQVINILSDTSAYNIIRLDVKDFFESIDFNFVLKKIETDNIVSNSSLARLRHLKKALPESFEGLPRGLAISSVLSELFMEDIDSDIRSTPGVYFYARYVDDMIIITHDKDIALPFFQSIFKNKKLELNDKSSHLTIPTVNSNDEVKSFNFLGYNYHIHSDKNKEEYRKITIDISQKKIKKIKTRIIKSILSYSNNRNEELLIKRIKFLTGNYTVKIDRHNKRIYSEEDATKLKGGIYYNNKFINTSESLLNLNEYLKKLLFCSKSNAIGSAIKKIPIKTRRLLISNCFISGHNRAIHHNFTEDDIQEIRKCWR